MKIVLLGAPGSGKGTHAKYLAQQLNVPHISTGDIFREAMAKQTELGKLAKSLIDHGNFVPDDITIGLVRERLNEPDCKNGFILDGFPRTLFQGKSLSEMQSLDVVLYFDIEFEHSLRRLMSRRVCKNCGEIYNLINYNKPTCEKCGGELFTRDDDKEEVITKRFKVYEELTFPLVEYYEQLGLLKHVKIVDSLEENRQNILEIIGELND